MASTLTIRKPALVRGNAAHSPAGGVAPGIVKAAAIHPRIGHALHQHKALSGGGFPLTTATTGRPLSVKFK